MPYKLICPSADIVFGEAEDTVIVTGWTKPTKLTAKIPNDMYAAMGTLYSCQGIEYLIRNLLANPQITTIHCLSLTRADENSMSIAVLKDLWSYGFLQFKEFWKIRSRHGDFFLLNDLPIGALFDLITNTKLYVWENIKNINWDIPKGIQRDEVYHLPYEVKKVESYSLPYGHTITAKSIPSAWLTLLSRVRKYGAVVPSNSDGFWQELLNLSVTITFEIDEFPDYLPCTDNDLERYYELMCTDKVFANIPYTYGHRIKAHFGYNQLQLAKSKILTGRYSNHNVINLWDVEDIIHGSCPCLTQIWVKVSPENKLNCFAIFRSNDMYGAWVQNAYGLRQVQKELVEIIQEDVPDIELGNLTINSLSAHIYDFCFQEVDGILQQYYLPKVEYDDPVGSFLIQIEEHAVKVQNQKFGTTYELKRYRQFKEIMQNISEDYPTIQPYHAMYLGSEITSAYRHMLNNLPYEQDRLNY